MMRQATKLLTLVALAGLLAGPLGAQLQVPAVVPPVKGIVGDVTGRLDQTVGTATTLTEREARRLLRLRMRTLDRLLRAHPQAIERDLAGNLARRGELLVTGASNAELGLLEQAGFRIAERARIEGLDIAFARLTLPAGMSLAEAQAQVAGIVPGVQVEADTLHIEAGGEAERGIIPTALPALPITANIGVKVGIIDGGTGKAVPVSAQKGFAIGAPHPSNHGSAVAGLLHGNGATRLWVADVYGTDPAGGNTSAIAKGLGWLTANGCKVVTVSLVGPRSLLLERAIASAQEKGVVVIAAVGNDGPAAPPAYPASYSGVVAITGVDRKGRALIEAGRALHLDYAAPGAEVYAMDAKGARRLYRGTSFATPLAAARLAAAMGQGGGWRKILDREARDLGAKGPDETFGRGVLCEGCGKKK